MVFTVCIALAWAGTMAETRPFKGSGAPEQSAATEWQQLDLSEEDMEDSDMEDSTEVRWSWCCVECCSFDILVMIIFAQVYGTSLHSVIIQLSRILHATRELSAIKLLTNQVQCYS